MNDPSKLVNIRSVFHEVIAGQAVKICKRVNQSL